MSRFRSLDDQFGSLDNERKGSAKTELLTRELKTAGIPVFMGTVKMPGFGKVFTVAGKLHGWQFDRRDDSWLAYTRSDSTPGIPSEVGKEFNNQWHGEANVHAFHVQPGTNDESRYFNGHPIRIYDIKTRRGLAAFAELIRSLEAPKDAPTETPEQAVAAPTEAKPLLYQKLVYTLAGEASLIEEHPEIDRAILCAHMFNVQLQDASFPDPIERAWILTKLEEVKAKCPEASRILGLDKTIALFKS